MREDWENGHRELEAKYEARLNELKSDLELRRKVISLFASHWQPKHFNWLIHRIWYNRWKYMKLKSERIVILMI
jgi:hypothetical protein